jgi:MFS family permease
LDAPFLYVALGSTGSKDIGCYDFHKILVMNEPARPDLPRNVKVLGYTSLINDIASEMIFPLLPTFLLTVLVGGNKFFLGLIEGVADSVASILKLLSGSWSDRIGTRKGFVWIGYSLAALSRPLIGIIVLPWQLLTIRTADRIGKGIRTSPRDALIADSADPGIRGRAFGFDRAMDHLGAALGPLIALLILWLMIGMPALNQDTYEAMMQPENLRNLFLLTLAPGIAVVCLIFFGLREPPRTGQPREKIRLTLQPFDNNFRLFLLSLVVFTLGNSSDLFLLVRAKDLGVPEVLLLPLWCAFHIVKSSGNIVMGRAVDRFGPRPLLFSGWFLYAAIYLAFALATESWQAWVFFLTYAVFYALTDPSEKTLVAILAGSQRKGLAYGWYNFAIGIATLPASLLFGLLYQEVGPLAAFGSGAALALLASFLLLGVREK